MKKLLALLIVGGLLSMTTGCPPSSTSKPATPKAGKVDSKPKTPAGDNATAGKDKDKEAKLAKAADKRKAAADKRKECKALEEKMKDEKDKAKADKMKEDAGKLKGEADTLEADAKKLEEEAGKK